MTSSARETIPCYNIYWEKEKFLFKSKKRTCDALIDVCLLALETTPGNGFDLIQIQMDICS